MSAITWWQARPPIVRRLLVAFSLSLFALTPVLLFNPGRADHPPPYSFPSFAEDDVDLKIVPSVAERVYILVRRNFKVTGSSPYVAPLIWLPLAVAIFTIAVFREIHRNVRIRRDLIIFAAAGLAGLVGLFWSWEWLPLLLLAVAFPVLWLITRSASEAVPSDGKERKPDLGVRAHLLTITSLVLCAAVLSSSTHVMLVKYVGYAPSTDQFGDVAAKFDQLIDEIAPSYIRDDAAWRMDQVPSLNRGGLRMTLFGLNRCAAIGFVSTVAAYMFLWPTVILHHRRRVRTWTCKCGVEDRTNKQQCAQCHAERGYDVLHFVEIVFASLVYITAGVGFAIIFYNDYTTEAAKQNVMASYADYLVADGDRTKQLEDYFRREGWSDSIEQEILRQARLRHDESHRLADFIQKTRANFWPSTVIAHETPRVHRKDVPTESDKEDFETEFAVDPLMSFHDMIYFSFVSFTTTGYGDVRPVSDDLRFWTIVENIMEILFVAMFIGVAIDG